MLRATVEGGGGIRPSYQTVLGKVEPAAECSDLFRALPKQLGLRLEPSKGPVEYLVGGARKSREKIDTVPDLDAFPSAIDVDGDNTN